MTDTARDADTFEFDAATRALIRLAARIAGGSELDVRAGLEETATSGTPAIWVEEVILQSYLFAGFPRTLNAAREWRRQGQGEGRGVGQGEGRGVGEGDFRALGEATCALVYGKFYEKLRHNIFELHPELDDWMIEEGYGKVLSRPGLDLARRELCIIAACVAAGQDRQLHSHLHGARNVGVPDSVIAGSLAALAGAVPLDNLSRAMLLWRRVDGKRG
ncbi:MAG: carboxymuconolactone decarboxylase family protein [Gemmatimonadaceae bacterium]